MANKRELVDRWTADERRSSAVLAALQSGGPLDALSFGAVDGRLDFRGFTLPAIPVVGQTDYGNVTLSTLARERPRVSGAALADLDFSGARLELLTFDRCRLTNVLFDGSTFDDVGFIWSDLTSCSFDRVMWRDGLLSLGDPSMDEPRVSKGTHYVDCSFESVKVSGTMIGDRAEFDRCRLSGRWSQLSLKGVVLRDCQWSGTIKGLQFDGRPIVIAADWRLPAVVRTDFSSARFEDVSFMYMDIESVTWPSADRYTRIAGDVAGFLAFARPRAERLKSSGPSVTVGYIDIYLPLVRPDQSDYIILADDSTDPDDVVLERAFERDILAIGSEFPGATVVLHEPQV
ncbi:MAG: pentapeptide repeat-containing protein [Actinomycetota bacterium]|nr:pentapeptide repeat-containing protein [Actinomycetota bacterium]